MQHLYSITQYICYGNANQRNVETLMVEAVCVVGSKDVGWTQSSDHVIVLCWQWSSL